MDPAVGGLQRTLSIISWQDITHNGNFDAKVSTYIQLSLQSADEGVWIRVVLDVRSRRGEAKKRGMTKLVQTCGNRRNNTAQTLLGR